MGWRAGEVFPYNQTNLLKAEKFVGSVNPKERILNTGKAQDTKKVTDANRVGVAGSSPETKAEHRTAHVEGHQVASYVNHQGFCATLSIIWIKGALAGEADRKIYLDKESDTSKPKESTLERLAMVYASDPDNHAGVAGLTRRDIAKWKAGDKHLRAWLYGIFSKSGDPKTQKPEGWNKGAWNLTRVRKRPGQSSGDRHRLAVYSAGGEDLFVFNSTRGEWQIFKDERSQQSQQEAFFAAMGKIGLESTSSRGDIVELEVWECRLLKKQT